MNIYIFLLKNRFIQPVWCPASDKLNSKNQYHSRSRAIWLFVWTQHLQLCFAAVHVPDQITLSECAESDKLPPGLQFRSRISEQTFHTRFILRQVALVHKADVCFADRHPDGVLVLYRFFSWRSRRNRYFSCRDKEQLYCSVITFWLCPLHTKCTWTKFHTLRKYRTEILLYRNYKKEHYVYLISCNVIRRNVSGLTLMTKHLK